MEPNRIQPAKGSYENTFFYDIKDLHVAFVFATKEEVVVVSVAGSR